MPRNPKIVMVIQMISLISHMLFIFARLDSVAAMGLALQIAIFTGLYTRKTAAWLAARWLSGIGFVVLVICLLLTMPSLFLTLPGTKLWVWAMIAGEAALSWFFFSLLGRPDSREYFMRHAVSNQVLT